MNTAKWLFPITFFLLPIVYIGITPNGFDTPKELLLITTILLSLSIWSVKNIRSKSLTLSTSPLSLALGGFALVVILNLSMNPEGRFESIVGVGGLYLIACLWSYLLSMQDHASFRKMMLVAFLGSTTILALHSLLQLTLLYRLTSLPTFMQTQNFSLTGNALTTFLYIGIGTGVSFFLLLKTHGSKLRALLVSSSILQLVAAIALGFLLLPGQALTPLVLPYSAAWNVALDAMKSVRSFIFGIGITNFPLFYKSVKPLFLNTTPFWNTSPLSASSELLQVLTTLGILGVASYAALAIVALKTAAKHTVIDKTFYLITCLTGIILVLTPASTPCLVLFFTAMGVLAARPTKTIEGHGVLTLMVSISTLALVGLTGFYTYKIYHAEIYMRQAQLAFAKNDGKKVYEANLAAIKLIPNSTNYHLSYSQVNLALAAALSQKSSLSDEDRKNVTQLVSQAINEGKLATNLRPHDATTWSNLGALYRNLINVASDSSQFAIDAYGQAVKLDPGNAVLRVEFGGLLYQIAGTTAKPEDQSALLSRAQGELQTAIQLKPDFPNAYYNLSKVLETAKEYQNSYLAMQKALSLLGPNSADLSKVTSELDALKTKLPKPSPTPTTTPKPSQQPSSTELSQPSPLPSPLPGGEIKVPESQ